MDGGKIVALAGGSGFIGRAIARRLAAIPGLRVRILTRNPDPARRRLALGSVDFVRGEVTDPATLNAALVGASTIVDTVQFDGYPVEDPRRGLTFDRVDRGGVINLIAAAREANGAQFIYISGAAADESSSHPGFRAKGLAERAIRESGLVYTIFRPSIVYGREDKIVNNFAAALRFSPIFPVPGSGRQKLQPVLVDDLAACVALAISGRGRNGTYDVGGPDVMTFDDMVRLIMEITGRKRMLVHVPERIMRALGDVLEKLPRPLFSRDAVTFVTADNVSNIKPLIDEFGIQLTQARAGMSYLRK